MFDKDENKVLFFDNLIKEFKNNFFSNWWNKSTLFKLFENKNKIIFNFEKGFF